MNDLLYYTMAYSYNYVRCITLRVRRIYLSDRYRIMML
jgi:hypothetical protein